MKYSIVMATHNNAMDAVKAIDSLKKHARTNDYEIIIVDDFSGPEHSKILRQIKDVVYIKLPINISVAPALNTGICASSGKYIMRVDDDIIMKTPNYLNIFSHWFETDKKIGILGCITNMKTTKAGNHKMSDIKNSLFITSYIYGFCQMFPIEYFNAVGGFAEDYPKVYGEDIDFVFRLNKAGYKSGFIYDVFCEHNTVKRHKDKYMDEANKMVTDKWQ